ncbi:MAG: YpdA family putative bacillithiol disulfide reductase [Thermoanaerobaculia bacterium]
MRGAATSLDLLVVGAGPTGIAVGAEARAAGLSVLLVDRGPLTANLLEMPVYMRFFTTRDKLEIADVPFTSADDKPDLRQALVYYRAVVERHELPLALHEEVLAVEAQSAGFAVRARSRQGESVRLARAVVVATGYFGTPRRLGMPGEERPWVRQRYREPYRHSNERVVLVGGGNSVCEAALELWRAGARVTLVVRRSELKPSIKYWLKPDIENRIEEGSVSALFQTTVESFGDRVVAVRGPGGRQTLAAEAAYVLIGYDTDAALLRRCGIEVDPDTLAPTFGEATCETNVLGLYVAGTVQSGRDTNHIFIENSRDHGQRIVRHLVARRFAG